MNDQALEDCDDLRGRLAGAEHRLGRAAAERAVVVDLRESQVFERQRAKPRGRRVDVDTPGPEIVQERAKRFPIHRSLSISG
jgi:hypothetical protein